MSRYIYQNVAKDGNGAVITGAIVTPYLAGTTTAVSIYAASTGGSAVNSVTTDATDGSFEFYVDDSDYPLVDEQLFDITVTKANYQPNTVSDVRLFPSSTRIIDVTATEAFLVRKDGDGGDIFVVDTTNSVVVIDGKLGILGSPSYPLDIWDGTIALVVGADNILTTRTNAISKSYRFGASHYLIAEEPINLISGASSGGSNIVNIGGGTSIMNAATQVGIYVGATTTTLTGTEAGRFDFSTTARDTRLLIWDVDNATLERVTVGVADSGGAGYKLLRIAN